MVKWPELSIFQDSGFWEEAWMKARQDSLYARSLVGRDGTEYWNRRATSFALHARSSEAQHRIAKVLHILGHIASLPSEAEVLDIGCGPGRYALALARRVKKVVALDPSPDMLSMLQSGMEEEGIDNIEPVQMGWEEVDLDELGWRHRFHVVLALMSPGIRDVPTLKKMIDASRQVCLLASHVRQEDAARYDLWEKLIGGKKPPLPEDPLYIFALLYSWGYFPSLDLERRVSRRELPVSEAIEELENFFYPYLELTPAVRQAIRDYVNSRAREGLYLQERELVTAYLYWSV
ncbi:MAG: methyltransferase domain-containing protein [Moorellaceae bacterium]